MKFQIKFDDTYHYLLQSHTIILLFQKHYHF